MATLKEQYAAFKKQWELMHPISPAPSYSSWREFYREKAL